MVTDFDFLGDRVDDEECEGLGGRYAGEKLSIYSK